MNPVVLLVFNRPDHTAATIDALCRNIGVEAHPLYVFADGARHEGEIAAIAEVRKLVKAITGFRSVEVIEAPRNQGLAKSVISGVSQVVNHHGRAIVVEDDLVTSAHFLPFMNRALDHYEGNEEVMSVSAFTPGPPAFEFDPSYGHDVYFNPRPSPWGWATWKHQWQIIDWKMGDYAEFRRNKEARREFDRMGVDLSIMLDDQMHGRINSWAIRWVYSHFKHSRVSVCPRYSYVDNIGCDGSGVHCGDRSAVPAEVALALESPRMRDQVEREWPMLERFGRQFDPGFRGRFKRFLIDVNIWP